MKSIVIFLLAGYTLALSQTKLWKQTSTADFSLGTNENVVITNKNGGALQLIHPLVRQNKDTLDSSIPKFVDYDDSGNYVMGWISNSRVYVQKFNSSKHSLTSSILVDDSGGVYKDAGVRIGLLNSGKFVVGWTAMNQSMTLEIRNLQFFNSNGSKIGANFPLYKITNGGGGITQAIADRTNERFVMISPKRGVNNDSIFITPDTIYLNAVIFTSNGIKIRDSIKVNAPGGGITQFEPNGAFHNGKLALAWSGDNDIYGPSDIYAALYDSNLVPLTSPMLLEQQRTTPSVAFDNNGNWCVTWVQSSYVFPGPPDIIHAQVFDYSGGKIGEIIQASNIEKGYVNGQKIIYTNNMFRVAWANGSPDGTPEKQWASYWKLEQITDGIYLSAVFDAGSSQTLFKTLSWSATTSLDTELKFQLRSSSVSNEIQTAPWLGPTSGSDFYTNASGEEINVQHNFKRYMQVKALFHSPTVGNTPVLNDFTIKYISSDSIAPQVPSTCVASGEHRRIELAWEKSISLDVKLYRIYRAEEGQEFGLTPFSEVNSSVQLYTDSSVLYNKKYRYSITAVDSTFNESAMILSELTFPRTMIIFISTSGSAQGPGTVNQPFSKINDGIKYSGDGDTVFVLPGEYNEVIKLKDNIALIGSGAGTTKILSSGSDPFLTTANHIIIKGFSFLVEEGLRSEANNVLITENIFIHQGANYDVAIVAGLNDAVVISKNIFLNFAIGIQATPPLHASTAAIIIRNNIIRCPTGIQNVLSNVSLINNTFVVEGASGIAISTPDGKTSIMNNCFAGYPSEGGYIRSIMEGFNSTISFEYNNRWNFNGDQADTVSVSNIAVDPQFKSYVKNNFHYSSSSQCINKGNPATGYNDIDGTRNDIGAYGGPDPLPDHLTFSSSTDLSLNTVSGFPGDTLMFNVDLSKTGGFKKGSFDIQFDSGLLSFISASTTTLTTDFTLVVVKHSESTVAFELNDTDEMQSGSGSIVKLKFLLNPSAAGDQRCSIEFGVIHLFDGEDNTIMVSSVMNGSCVVRSPNIYPNRIFVDGNNNGPEDGTILHPFSTIQEGIEGAQAGDTIIVAAGKYTGPISMKSKISVQGLGANASIIELPDNPGIFPASVVHFDHVDSARIQGFLLINYNSLGTVVEIYSSTASVLMNKIDQSGGGAMYTIYISSDSHAEIQDNYFVASKDGGFSMITDASNNTKISRNVFSSSTSQEIISLNSNKGTLISNNRFYFKEGWAITGYKSKNTVVANNLFIGNSSEGFGFRFLDVESTLVVNNIITDCKNALSESNGMQEIYNNIFINNTTAISVESSTNHKYNLFWNNELNFGNGTQDETEISLDPKFVNPGAGNYKLLPSSPAINAGTNQAQWNDKDGTRNDIGLYGGPYADSTMFAAVNSKLYVGNVHGTPGDTVTVPIYAVGIAGISGVHIVLMYDEKNLTLQETHTTQHTHDFVLLRKHTGSSMVELTLQGYRSIVLDSGAVLEATFVVSKNASGTIPVTLQNVQLLGASTQTIDGVSFQGGGIILGPSSVEPDGMNVPKDFALYQNFPNPFNPVTTIRYAIPIQSMVELKVYDILGRAVIRLLNEEHPPGIYQIPFNASSLSSGVYFYRIKAGNFVQTKRMLLLK